MFYDNKYRKWYFTIIEAAKSRKEDLIGERHHIVPKCLGGSDEEDNIVLLTFREHYVAHALLTKIHPSKDLIHAFWCMSFMNRKKYQNSHLYEMARSAYVENISGSNHPMKRKESREKISKSWNEERKNNQAEKVSGDKHWTKKRNMGDHAKFMRSKLTQEFLVENGKRSLFVTDNPMKQQSIAQKFKKPKEIVVCPHCNKSGGKPVMIRYHFDNCKSRDKKEF
jgi:hypothetical protein